MKYYLTAHQYRRIWGFLERNAGFDYRKEQWNIRYGHTKITWDEGPLHVHGFWGILEGDEKHITWFLLQI